jgi:hypothetical protein
LTRTQCGSSARLTEQCSSQSGDQTCVESLVAVDASVGATVTKLAAKVPLTKLQDEPVVILVEHIDIQVEEPAVLKTSQNLLAKLLKQEEPSKKKDKDSLRSSQKKEKEKDEKVIDV